MFNPNNLDDVCAQATHLEARGKNTPKEGSKNPFKGKEKKRVSRERKMHTLKWKERKQYVNIVPDRFTMKLIFRSFIPK